MGNLLAWNTLNNRVKSYVDPQNDIETPQHAFAILMVATILGISDEDAADSFTDGGKDRGVDAAYIDATDNGIHIFQFKYVNTFEASKKNFPSGEIDKLVSYFKDLLDVDKKMKMTCNPILWGKTQEIWIALNRPDPKIYIHFCGNLEVMEPSEKKRATEAFETDEHFTVHHHSLTNIVKLFIEHAKPKINRDISVVDKDYFDRTDGNIRGMICSVEAKEIVSMVTNPTDTRKVIGEIFNDNVRIYLSNSNKINKKIIESAVSEENALFWYLNNGITMTCDSFSYVKGKRSPRVELKNVQIVNGGQTTHALFEAFHQDADALDNVLVMVRIIETKSREVSLAIAESTNSQTPIKGRDLRSNDDVQKKLELAYKDLGYFYERKAKQWQSQERTKRIDAQEAGQARLAYTLGLPEVAKKDRGRVFADLYDTVFSEDVSAEELLCAYRLMNHIDKLKKAVQKAIREEKNIGSKLFLIDGALHVLYALYLLCVKNDINPTDYERAVKQVNPAIKLVQGIVTKHQKKDDSFSFNRFFKDAKTKDLIAAAV